ncbi:hypothetical protein [Mycolicibacterium sp.]|nr:hypothetical protein [Mycolicibacterium sp.]
MSESDDVARHAAKFAVGGASSLNPELTAGKVDHFAGTLVVMYEKVPG